MPSPVHPIAAALVLVFAGAGSFAMATEPPIDSSGAAATNGAAPGPVFVRFVVPSNPPEGRAKQRQPPVEAWIAKELRRRGERTFHAASSWVRLAEPDADAVLVWGHGEQQGCPVSGQITERTPTGIAKIELSGWTPVGGALAIAVPAVPGRRLIQLVDDDEIVNEPVYVVLDVRGPKAVD